MLFSSPALRALLASLVGATPTGFAARHNLVAGEPWGVTRFTQYLAEKY
ncbi:MAG: hypothetical protein IT190_00480 [Microbacteriaceae bacterium]|nr:hypothetical protein [Microbacteriaceae bacterium]